MHRILLVDDDTIARIKIKNLIDWNRIGCSIVGEAANGSEALLKIGSLRPDIVFVDMDMPVMDGVTLVRYLKEMNQEIAVIALSAYDDFHYVKESMKYGAVDYILKHQLNSRKIEEVINEINKHTETVQNDAEFENKKADLSGLEAFLSGNYADRETAFYKGANVSFLLGVFCQDYEDPTIDEHRMKYSCEICTETLNQYSINFICDVYEGKLVVLVIQIKADRNAVLHMFAHVKRNILRYLKLTVSYSVSMVFQDIEDCHDIYMNEIQKGREEITKSKELSILLQSEDIQLIENRIQDGNFVSLAEFLAQFISESIEYANKNQIILMIVEIGNVFHRQIRQDDRIEDENKDKLLAELNDLLFDMRDIENMEGSIHKLNKFVEDYRTYAEQMGNLTGNTLVDGSIQWIMKHYGEQISPIDVAEAMNVNNSYLSRIFKKCTGENLVNYINTYKLQVARRLIETGEYSLNEIAEKVGYVNYNYFSSNYKKFYGEKPSDTKRQLTEQKGICKK